MVLPEGSSAVLSLPVVLCFASQWRWGRACLMMDAAGCGIIRLWAARSQWCTSLPTQGSVTSHWWLSISRAECFQHGNSKHCESGGLPLPPESSRTFPSTRLVVHSSTPSWNSGDSYPLHASLECLRVTFTLARLSFPRERRL